MDRRANEETTRRWVLPGIGRDRLELRTGPIPAPGPHDVLMRIDAVSLNYRDTLLIDTGLGFALPNGEALVPGSDAAGEVVAVGPAVSRFKPGDKAISVFLPGWIDGPGPGTARQPGAEPPGGPLQGFLRDHAVVNEESLVHAPQSLTSAEASTLPCAGVTAWTALVERGGVRAGQTVLVEGTGGVALFGLQIARAHGAEVIVTSSDDAKLVRAKSLGATHAINYRHQDWVDAVHALTNDRGADHILEIVGGKHLGKALDAAAVTGHVYLIGVIDGFDVSGGFASLALKRLSVEGIQVGSRRNLEDLVRAIDATGIKPVIDHVFEMEELPQALVRLSEGPFGKVVIATQAKRG